MEAAFGGFSLVVVIFLLFLAILWFILPFAIFGTKAILRDILEEQKRQTKLLETIIAQASDQVEVTVERAEPRLK